MKSAIELLDAVKARHAIISDYALAGFLGVTRSTISNHRKNPHSFDPELCIKVADALHIPREQVMLYALTERAKSHREQAVYLGLLNWAEMAGKAVAIDPPPGYQHRLVA